MIINKIGKFWLPKENDKKNPLYIYSPAQITCNLFCVKGNNFTRMTCPRHVGVMLIFPSNTPFPCVGHAHGTRPKFAFVSSYSLQLIILVLVNMGLDTKIQEWKRWDVQKKWEHSIENRCFTNRELCVEKWD
jgi:hypothetical protein